MATGYSKDEKAKNMEFNWKKIENLGLYDGRRFENLAFYGRKFERFAFLLD